jgi:LmbE family N-acetylglucosaminyl deacetylase
MKKIIFGIFAHPDDEAFGPAGTLLLETRSGTELHLVSLTNGNAGTNQDNLSNLGETRLKEWRKAGELIGAKTMHHFGYKDGELNNVAMIEISQRIIDLVKTIVNSSTHSDTSIEFMTTDLNGITGHIDHIVAARATCLAFYKLKETNDMNLDRIRFACLPISLLPQSNVEWIYMEAGRSSQEIGETIDARHLRQEIIAVMHTHYTQRNDSEYNIKLQGSDLGLNHFLVKR